MTVVKMDETIISKKSLDNVQAILTFIGLSLFEFRILRARDNVTNSGSIELKFSEGNLISTFFVSFFGCGVGPENRRVSHIEPLFTGNW